MRKLLIIVTAIVLSVAHALAQSLSDKYNAEHPLIIVGDWDKAPYEFLNDQGQPAGSNVDLMKTICKELNIHCQFVLKEWSGAIKTFERRHADIILANVRRYRKAPYYTTENVINYNRICAASLGDTATAITTQALLDGGVALKPGDYTTMFFRDLDSLQATKVEYQSPKVALQGLLAGDYSYFVWGEEPLRWKIKELNLKGIVLSDVQIPVSEIHVVGYDRSLIYEIDDLYSRLKQSGEVQRINDSWLHPDRAGSEGEPLALYIVLGVLLLASVVYGFNRIARTHVQIATRKSTELNNMMYKALHMGNLHVMEYDIQADLWTSRFGSSILPAKGITLQEFTSHIHPHEVEEFTQKMNRLLSGRERKFELKKRWLAYDDSERWMNLEGHAIVELDAAGRPAYIINAVNDVTKTVEEERTTHEMACKYVKMANLPFVAMSFYSKDGWLIDLNDAMRDLCQIDENDPESIRFWTNVNVFDMPLFRNAFSPDDKEEVLLCQHMLYENLGIDRYIEFHVRPLFDAAGQVANYFVSAIDITDERNRDHDQYIRNRKTRKIQQDIDRYEKWMNFLTKEGNTYLWNSNIAQQTAWFYRSLQGKGNDYIVMPFATHVAHMPPDEGARALAYFNNQDPRQKPFDSIQYFFNTVLDTGKSWFRISGTPVFDQQGHVIGHRGQSIDVTQEMATQERLAREEKLAQESMRLKSGFMASMTHELRTPLNAIIGFTDVLRVIDSAQERSEYIRIIRNNCDMLQRLINDILTASSLNEGPTSIEEEDVDFSKEFNDICLTLQQRMEPGVDFIRENPYHSLYTRLDKGRVAQVITNFVTNSVKFTKEGYIKVGYRYENHGLRIYCEDTGVGIPRDKQDIIFDRFVKLDEFVQGTGMGLSICKSIAERCGGQVGVSSEGPGRGCTFWMWIPCERRLSAAS